MDLEALKYPIGQVDLTGPISHKMIAEAIDRMSALPQSYRNEIKSLDEDQLGQPYRPGGWTLRQVVHHVSESHMNGFVRFKWALTEDTPRIKAYFEERWSELQDDSEAPVNIGLNMLEALHVKWVYLMKHMDQDQWNRQYYHPEANRAYHLKESLMVYDWHGRHHLAHITTLKQKMNW